jgi:hypothetical protein
MKIRWILPVAVFALGCQTAAQSSLVTGPVTSPLPTPEPTSQPAARPTLPLRPAAIYADNFDGVRGEWQQTSGVWEVRDSLLLQRSDDGRHMNAVRFVQQPRVADATIETKLAVLPTKPAQWTDSLADKELQHDIRYVIGAGLVFRMQDRANYYMFRLGGEEGAVVGKMVDNVWTDLCNPRARNVLDGRRIGFTPSNPYVLKVTLRGSQITAFINDEPVCRVSDQTFSIGQVGLVTFKTAAAFDYIAVLP